MDKKHQGTLSHLKGEVAEQQIVDAYIRCGFQIVERRWKTAEGEIDIIAQHENKFYFIEVKSSSTFEKAVERITPLQCQRIQNAALVYLSQKKANLEIECRFDAALVDGKGRIKVLAGALIAA